MFDLACWCVLAVVFGSSHEGRGHVDIDRSQAVTWTALGQREALVLCVRAGMGPDQIGRLFGSPSLTSRFRDGPYEWWYPKMRATVRWPAKLYEWEGPGWLTPEDVMRGIQ